MNAVASRRWCPECMAETFHNGAGCCFHQQPRQLRPQEKAPRRRAAHRGRPLTAHLHLTMYEAKVAAFVADGLGTHIIARRLRMARGTVWKHLENIREKTGIHERKALAAHLLRVMNGECSLGAA